MGSRNKFMSCVNLSGSRRIASRSARRYMSPSTEPLAVGLLVEISAGCPRLPGSGVSGGPIAELASASPRCAWLASAARAGAKVMLFWTLGETDVSVCAGAAAAVVPPPFLANSPLFFGCPRGCWASTHSRSAAGGPTMR